MNAGHTNGVGRRHRVTLALSLFLLFLNFGLMVLLFMLSALGREGETVSAQVPGLGMTWQVTLWLIIASGVVFTILMFFGIIRPLHLITSSLHKGTPRPLYSLLREPTEMGDLARLMQRSFQQREQLEHEIGVRRQAQNRVLEREAQLKEMTQDRERLIHDLHDGLIQSLYGIGLKLESIRSGAEPQQEREAGLSAVIAEINTLLSNLRGSLQGSAGLLHRVRSLSGSLADLAGKMRGEPRVVLECSGDLDEWVTPDQARELYAICSEALMNAVRHARAGNIILRAGRRASFLEIGIEDDGVGMPAAVEGGLGLNSMSRRAARIGARIAWQAGSGRGTRVVVELPLDAPTGGKERGRP